MECFSIYYEDIEGRIDPYYYISSHINFDSKLDSIKYKIVNFEKCMKSIINGLDFRDFSENCSIYLRVSNIKPFEIDLIDVKRVSLDVNQVNKKVELKQGNVLLTRKGTFGIATSIKENLDYIISSEIFKIDLKENVNSDFIVILLNSSICQRQFDRNKIGAIMGSLSQSAVKSIKIPFPPSNVQEKIVEIMQNAYTLKKQKENEAKILFNSIDYFVLNKLGIKLPENDEKMCYPVFFNELDGRINPAVYHPKRMNTIHNLKLSSFPLYPLHEVVDFKKEIVTDAQDLTYVGLENIESNTGIFLTSTKEKETFGSAFSFKKGDVLFPKLRPYLNKVHFAKFDGICSTEFHVLREKKCDGFYLFSFLRSNVVVNQTSFLMTGNTLPRLQTADVENLLIPVPSPEIQSEISNEVMFRIEKAELLQQEAQEILEKAEIEVEKIIMGD